MSLLDKAMASVGVGAAKVLIQLNSQKFCKGDLVNGLVRVLGGKTEQRASKISLILMAYIDFEENRYDNKKPIEISKFDVAHDVTIKPNQELRIPFSFVLPTDTPSTFDKDMVWIETSLDIKKALDPSNKVYIDVMPHPYTQRILDVVQENWKFELTKYENIYVPNNGRHLPIVPVYEFNSTASLIENIEKMRMMFFVDDLRGLEIIIELPGSNNTINLLIHKKEFEKSNSNLADILLNGIKSHFHL